MLQLQFQYDSFISGFYQFPFFRSLIEESVIIGAVVIYFSCPILKCCNFNRNFYVQVDAFGVSSFIFLLIASSLYNPWLEELNSQSKLISDDLTDYLLIAFYILLIITSYISSSSNPLLSFFCFLTRELNLFLMEC